MPAVATMERPGSAEIRVAGSTPARAQAPRRGLGPLGLRRSRLAVDVGNAEPAPHHQLGQSERGEERAQHLGRLLERGRVEDLAADVRVDAHQLDAGHELERGHGLGRRARGDGEAELGVLLPGAHELVRVRLDAGRDPHQDLGPVRRPAATTPAGGRGGRSRRTSRRRSGRRRAPGPSPALRPTCCCRAGRAARAGRRPRARHGARRRRPRRGACPPRGPGGPWRGTGRPWWRRRPRRPTPRPPHGRPGADGPRRRRRAACRILGQLQQVDAADVEVALLVDRGRARQEMPLQRCGRDVVVRRHGDAGYGSIRRSRESGDGPPPRAEYHRPLLVQLPPP